MLENPTVAVIQQGLIEHESASDPHPQYPTLAETRQVVDLRDYGDPTGVTLMPAGKFNQALSDAANRTLYMPGTFRVGASSATECILQTAPCRVISDGLGQSGILVDPSVGPTVDIWRVSPTVSGESEFGWEYAGFRLKAASGTPGRHGFSIDLPDSAARFLARLRMSQVWIGPFGARAFSMDKAGTDINGFFTSLVEACRFDGGPSADAVVWLNRSGDSLTFADDTITGYGVGVHTAPVIGAAQQNFVHNNVTARGGAFRVVGTGGGSQVKIVRNQLEQSFPYTGSPTDDAVIVLDSISECLIEHNNMSGYDQVSGVHLKGNSSRNRIAGNTIDVSATAGKQHFVIDASCQAGNDIGLARNTYLTAGALALAPRVANAATTAQIGIWAPLTLANGWAPTAPSPFVDGLQALVTSDRVVHLRGAVMNGTNTAATTIATLPTGMRPLSDAVRITVHVLSGGVWALGVLTVISSGEIQIPTPVLPATTLVNFDGVTFQIY